MPSCLWDEYVTAAVAAGILPAKGPELSRVLLHMAALFPSDPEEVWDVFDVESEEALQRLVRAGQLPACFDRGDYWSGLGKRTPTPRCFAPSWRIMISVNPSALKPQRRPGAAPIPRTWSLCST